jgi:mgtE-like transporter
MRPRPPRRFVARVRAAVGPDAAGLRQSLAATLVSSGGDLLAGLTLASIEDDLTRLVGLIVLVPAAIGMRGNIFGALGSRLGTAIHTGTFSLSRRRDTVVGQNVLASAVLTLAVSAALAVLAKTIASAFSPGQTISVADYLVISVLGGVLSSVVVLGLTLVVAAQSVRRGWDMDNVAGPLVTAAGDMVTLPALWVASKVVGIEGVTPIVAALCALLAVASLVAAARTHLPLMQRLLRESLPILLVAGTIDLLAGVTLQARLEDMARFPALLILIPPFLEDTGALGSILSSRLSTKLHLGIIDPVPRPQKAARRDFGLIAVIAVPVFVLVGLSADVAAFVAGKASPGPLDMISVALLGGTVATATAVLVAYFGGVATYRLGLDPDTYGVPLLTSTMDFVGALALILAMAVMGVA